MTCRNLFLCDLSIGARKKTNKRCWNRRSHICTNYKSKRHIYTDNSCIECSKRDDRCSGTGLHYSCNDRTNEHKSPDGEVCILRKIDSLRDDFNAFLHITKSKKKKSESYQKLSESCNLGIRRKHERGKRTNTNNRKCNRFDIKLKSKEWDDPRGKRCSNICSDYYTKSIGKSDHSCTDKS